MSLLHRAGVPEDVLQLVPGDGSLVGARLVNDRRIAGVAFTGSTETAWAINRALAARDGAIIPLIPFFTMETGLAIWVSLTVAMLAHFAVGAARSIFTGRSFWTSGRDMFLVGFAVAAAGYLIGGLLMAP